MKVKKKKADPRLGLKRKTNEYSSNIRTYTHMAIFSKETSTHISDEVEINCHKMRDSGAPYPLPPSPQLNMATTPTQCATGGVSILQVL